MANDEPATFGLMLRKPGPRIEDEYGDETPVYTAPRFDEPRRAWQVYAGTDPRQEPDTEWALALPHQCGDWEIWDGPRDDVLAAAYRFRTELDAAIAVMEAATDA